MTDPWEFEHGQIDPRDDLHEDVRDSEKAYVRWKTDNTPLNIERVRDSDMIDYEVWFDGMNKRWHLTARQLERLAAAASAEIEIYYREKYQE